MARTSEELLQQLPFRHLFADGLASFTRHLWCETKLTQASVASPQLDQVRIPRDVLFLFKSQADSAQGVHLLYLECLLFLRVHRQDVDARDAPQQEALLPERVDVALQIMLQRDGHVVVEAGVETEWSLHAEVLLEENILQRYFLLGGKALRSAIVLVGTHLLHYRRKQIVVPHVHEWVLRRQISLITVRGVYTDRAAASTTT